MYTHMYMLIFPYVNIFLQKHTPLYIAMANDHIDIVRRLLYNGADCRTIDDIVSIVIKQD
jgi:ankyrin repeat protein